MTAGPMTGASSRCGDLTGSEPLLDPDVRSVRRLNDAPIGCSAVRCRVPGFRVGGARSGQRRCRQPVVRELGWQCHASGFGGEHRRIERKNGYLPAHRHRLAGAQDRDSRPRRFGGHGAAGQERGPGHPDGCLQPRLRLRHCAESRRRTAVHPSRAEPLVERRRPQPHLQHHAGMPEALRAVDRDWWAVH